MSFILLSRQFSLAWALKRVFHLPNAFVVKFLAVSMALLPLLGYFLFIKSVLLALLMAREGHEIFFVRTNRFSAGWGSIFDCNIAPTMLPAHAQSQLDFQR